MTFRPSDLRSIPLFANITDAHLEQLVGAFGKRTVSDGDTIFSSGDTGDKFRILVEGEVSLREDGEERFRLRAPAPIGELGALTGSARRLSAVAAGECQLLEQGADELVAFFEDHGDIAFPFHHNLLRVVSDKIRRDRRRLDQMRDNIITTQKAMKRMRDALLDSEDTPLHAQLYEELDSLIEQNKKGHYLVAPVDALPTRVRTDDGTLVRVLALSNEWLHVAPHTPTPPKVSDSWSGVLVMADDEIPVTGTVECVDEHEVVIFLDSVIDDYERKLEDHLTRLQMLDVVL